MIWHLNIGEKMWYIESDHEETESGLFINIRYLLSIIKWRITKAPTTHNWPTDRCFTYPATTNNGPPTHRLPTTNHRPTDKCSTNPPTTDSPTSLTSTYGSPTPRPYYIDQQSFDSQIWVTIGPILSVNHLLLNW